MEKETWHSSIVKQLKECPLCGAESEFEVTNRNDNDEWGIPLDGEQDERKKLWRIKCESCGCMLVESNWHRLLKKWDRRYYEEKVKSAADKAVGQVEYWLPQIKRMQERLATIERILGEKVSS